MLAAARLESRSILLFAAMLPMLLACADGRPDAAGAAVWLERLCPGARVEASRITEDEVRARSFELVFWKAGSSRRQTLQVQFMATDGVWSPQPPVPETVCQ